MRKYVFIVFISILQFSSALAQHYTAWMRGTLELPLNTKWTIGEEFQHRRQSGLNSDNPLQENLMYSFRQWVYFRPNNSVRLALSPFAYYHSYNTIMKEGDKDHYTKEMRFTLAVETESKLVNKLSLITRNAAEYRVFSNIDNMIRLRNRLGVKYRITQNWSAHVSYELLLNVYGTTTEHFFDNDRFNLSISHRFGKHIDIDAGYLYSSHLPRTSYKLYYENAIVVNLKYSLPI